MTVLRRIATAAFVVGMLGAWTVGPAQAGGPFYPAKPQAHRHTIERTGRILESIRSGLPDPRVRIDCPIQDVYVLPDSIRMTARKSLDDVTPPSDPSNLTVYVDGIHSAYAQWSASEDPESGIDGYAYAIGTQPGLADISWWQSVGRSTRSYSLSLEEMGVAEGEKFYFGVHAANNAGLYSQDVFSDSAWFEWQDLGLPAYNLTIAYADYGYDSTGTNRIAGWSAEQIALFDHFLSRMNPIIKDTYGPPSHSYTVTLVKNLYYTGTNIFFPGDNEIHMSEDVYPQLLTHELIHAYRDNVILSTDDEWNYHPRLSGFEEAFAQGVSYVCMNRYVDLYPDDEVVDSTYLFGSSKDWDYDYQNVPAITTEDFWSDYGGTWLAWTRYELGAAAIRKMYLEDADVLSDFNQEYYSRLNADHDLTTSRDLMVDIFGTILSEVEGLPTAEWIGRQRVFDCTIVPGKKIWVSTQHYPGSQEYFIFQNIYHYETFSNGSDWAYWDGSQWVYYNSNGSVGTGTVYAYNDSVVWQDGLLIEPVENPPVYFGYGSDTRNFSTDSDTEPWPADDPADYVLNMTGFGLYHFDIGFGTASARIYRVIGEELRNTTGIFGGIMNAGGGHIFIDHEGYPAEDSIPVVDGAFRGARQWASVPNPKTGGTDSQPGRLTIRYVTSGGTQYTAKRNIDWGSWSGNQVFLFDTETMTLVSEPVAHRPGDSAPGPRLVSYQTRPNPFTSETVISFSITRSAHVEVLIYDVQGQRVKTLCQRHLSEGRHHVTWDGRNSTGDNVATGVYFAVISFQGRSRISKCTILR
ncbi:MAG: FlgD immunoglobulin-like domain containing protein [Candidatus Eisenbacteria bacterium]